MQENETNRIAPAGVAGFGDAANVGAGSSQYF
jgi:hypothetical protein